MFRNSIFIGKDVEVVATDKYIMFFRRCKDKDFLSLVTSLALNIVLIKT